jgi:glycerol 3-phosphatase-2
MHGREPISNLSLSPLLRQYDQVILDLDGCVWVGDEAVPGSPEAIAALRDAGKRVAFATNNSWHPGEDQVAKLWRIGVKASLADVVTVGGAVQYLLADTREGKTAFVIGTASLVRHVADAGLHVLNGTDLGSRAEVVVVGGTDEVGYDDLRTAALAARRNRDLIATGRDPTLPMPDGDWPGTGALLAAVETASGVTAQIVGKPEPQLFLTALDRMGDGRTLVVGDRVDSDVAAAAAAGLDAALVLSGGMSAEQAAEAEGPSPIAVADDLRSLVLDG